MNYPPMLTLCGQVANVFTTPVRTNKDGESYGGDQAVQMFAMVPLENGDHKMELVTLKTDMASVYKALMGRWVRVAAGVWARNGANGFFAVKGQRPEVLSLEDVAAFQGEAA